MNGLKDPPKRLATVLEVGARDFRWQSSSWDEVRHFTRAVVRELRETDADWGLNYKRGGPEISADVIAYYYGPTDRDCRLVDIVGGATGPNPSLYWGVIADDGAGALRWTTNTLFEGTEKPPPPPLPPLSTQIHQVLITVLIKMDALLTEMEEVRAQHARLVDEIASTKEQAIVAAVRAFEARGYAYDAKVESLNAAVRTLEILAHLREEPTP